MYVNICKCVHITIQKLLWVTNPSKYELWYEHADIRNYPHLHVGCELLPGFAHTWPIVLIHIYSLLGCFERHIRHETVPCQGIFHRWRHANFLFFSQPDYLSPTSTCFALRPTLPLPPFCVTSFIDRVRLKPPPKNFK